MQNPFCSLLRISKMLFLTCGLRIDDLSNTNVTRKSYFFFFSPSLFCFLFASIFIEASVNVDSLISGNLYSPINKRCSDIKQARLPTGYWLEMILTHFYRCIDAEIFLRLLQLMHFGLGLFMAELSKTTIVVAFRQIYKLQLHF